MEILDRTALEELLHDLLDDVRTFERFVADYVALWPGRFSTVHAALTRSDPEASETGALSIRASSIMLGAGHVVEVVDAVLAAVRRCDCAAARTRLGDLDVSGTAACHELSLLVADETHLGWASPRRPR